MVMQYAKRRSTAGNEQNTNGAAEVWAMKGDFVTGNAILVAQLELHYKYI